MDRYIYRILQEESSAVVLVQAHYIYSHKLPSCKTAPVERPRDITAICLLLCKEDSSVSALAAVRGATVDFRPPPVLCRMVIAAPGSFAFLGCTTASGETCSYYSHTQSLALKLSPTAGHLARSWPLHSVWALHAQGKLDAGGRRRKFLQIAITPHLKKRFYGSSPCPLIGSIMVQMQNQLQSGIELAQRLCIDWLIAAIDSVCYESQYNISYDHLKQCWFLARPSRYSTENLPTFGAPCQAPQSEPSLIYLLELPTPPLVLGPRQLL